MAQPIGIILQDLADMDIFYYALPFLLIFALVFAILQKVKLTGKENRGIDAIIALTVSLLSIQFNQVPIFFQIIFPKLGIGLAVILVCLILVGLFINPQKHNFAIWVFFGIGGITAIIILLTSFTDYSWWTGGFWYGNVSAIVAGIIILIFIFVIVNSGKEKPEIGGYRDPLRIVQQE